MIYYSPLPNRCPCYEQLCIYDYTFKFGTKIKTRVTTNLKLALWWAKELKGFSTCFLYCWLILFWVATFRWDFNLYLLILCGLLFTFNLFSASCENDCQNYAKKQDSLLEIMLEYKLQDHVDQNMNIILNNLKHSKNLVSIIDDYLGELQIIREYDIDIFE